jgi:hypothetical protein
MQHARRALTIPSSSARTRTRVGAHAQTRSQHATMLARRALCRLLSASAGCSSSRGVATSCARLARDAPSTPGGSAGSEGAAPGRVAGSDADVKFGSADSCERCSQRSRACVCWCRCREGVCVCGVSRDYARLAPPPPPRVHAGRLRASHMRTRPVAPRPPNTHTQRPAVASYMGGRTGTPPPAPTLASHRAQQRR